MNLNKLKPAWQQYKWAHAQLPIHEQELLSLLSASRRNRLKSLAVNLMMLLTLLLVCY